MNKILITVLFLAACSTPPSKKVEPSCWNESFATQIYEKLLAIGKSMSESSGETPPTAQLIESTCSKRKYRYGDRFFVLVNHKDGSVDAKTFKASEDPQKCLKRALDQIASYHSQTFDALIIRHQKMHTTEWQDPDLSPVGWLQCGSTQIDFDDSESTFLHELTHEVKISEKQCLYFTTSLKEHCFNLPKNLPHRSFAKLDSFPTKNPDALRFLESIQKVYLTNIDQPFISLLDEFNAYIVSNESYLRRYKTFGEKRIFQENGKRPGMISPLFYKYVVVYLSRLKKDQPLLFSSVFRENQINRDGVKKLITLFKKTYIDWQKYLKTQNKPEKEVESNLFKEAEKIEAKLDL